MKSGKMKKHPLLSKPRGFRLQRMFQMAAEEGFEPSQTESESGVLPLHKSAKRICYYTGFDDFVKS